jgi:hypothetical protein
MRPLERPRRRWGDNIRKCLREIQCGGVEFIRLVLDSDQWRVLVNTVLNFLASYKAVLHGVGQSVLSLQTLTGHETVGATFSLTVYFFALPTDVPECYSTEMGRKLHQDNTDRHDSP